MADESTAQPPATTGGAIKEYLIGGAIIRLRDDVDVLWNEIKAKLAEGMQLSPLFKLQWIRTALHLQHLGARDRELEERLSRLESEVTKLRKLIEGKRGR